jgi:RNA polymerase sigma-70 factor (ECF subfamily)
LYCQTNKRTHKDESTLTDTQLIQSTLEGNTHAFGLLVKRYESQVAGVVIGMLGPGPEAEDVGQETFIRFYKSLKRFRGDSGVGTYLTRIAINLSLNEIKRRKKRRGLFEHEENITLEYRTQNGYEQLELRQALQQAIQQLEPHHRSVVLLRLVQGYSTTETSKILNIPLGTVLSRLSRAQEKLKKLLSTTAQTG